jgi:biotin carboxyl carrier protein
VNYEVTVAGRTYAIEVEHDRLVRVNGQALYVELEQVGGLPVYSLALDKDGYVVFVEEGQGEYRVEVKGQVYPVEVQNQRPHLSVAPIDCPSDGGECLGVRAPLAGHLISLAVKAGDQVEAGQVLAVVESMKMKMELKAPLTGAVEAVHRRPGQDVGQEDELVTLRVS